MATVNWHDHEMQRIKVPAQLWRCFSGMVLPLAGTLLLASASVLIAQTSAPRRTAWDGVYAEAQATRGTVSFGQSCAGCHALGGEGRSPLTGDPFWRSFAQKNVSDLLDYVSLNMPNGTPGSLNESTYRDIVSVMLKSNGFPAGTEELRRDNISDVQIIQKDGRTDLPANSLVRVVGCLAKSGADWMITSATNPERPERGSGEDATRPLGKRTMQLNFVLTKLDALTGSRVAVNGLLLGDNGVDGINVTTVNRVAAKCP